MLTSLEAYNLLEDCSSIRSLDNIYIERVLDNNNLDHVNILI